MSTPELRTHIQRLYADLPLGGQPPSGLMLILEELERTRARVTELEDERRAYTTGLVGVPRHDGMYKVEFGGYVQDEPMKLENGQWYDMRYDWDDDPGKWVAVDSAEITRCWRLPCEVYTEAPR